MSSQDKQPDKEAEKELPPVQVRTATKNRDLRLRKRPNRHKNSSIL